MKPEFLKRLKHLTRPLAAALAGVSLALSPAPAAAEPALWLVKDEDSRIWLFGTVHVLPKDTVWRGPKVDAAMAEADELWMEIADLSSIGAQVVASILVLRYGLSPSRPLSSRLTAEEYAGLERAASSIGMDAASLDVMRPWMAGMMLQAGATVESGMDAAAGVELQLGKIFRPRRVPIKGFETMGDQIKVFSTLPEEEEVAFLRDTVEQMDLGDDSLGEMIDGWAKGDTSVLEDAIVEDMKASSPGLYDALITKRNANWVEQIEKMLAGEGDIFIAVGAGHLVGPDSVQAMLKAKGIEAVRQ
jgi:hypothetical protein